MQRLPLSGLHVLNTRPKEQATSLTSLIHALGGHSINVPTMEIIPTNWQREYTPPTTLDIVLFVSHNAVVHGLPYLSQTWVSTPCIAAIGQATAQTISQYHLLADIYPTDPHSEALLQHPSFQHVTGKTIQIIKGIGGRTLLRDTLIKKGADVLEVNVYQRVTPNNLTQHCAQIANQTNIDIIVITSLQSLTTLLGALTHHNKHWLKSATWLVMSERIAHEAKKFGVRKTLTAPKSNLKQALCGWHNQEDNA